jgi:hypothetical protein
MPHSFRCCLRGVSSLTGRYGDTACPGANSFAWYMMSSFLVISRQYRVGIRVYKLKQSTASTSYFRPASE